MYNISFVIISIISLTSKVRWDCKQISIAMMSSKIGIQHKQDISYLRKGSWNCWCFWWHYILSQLIPRWKQFGFHHIFVMILTKIWRYVNIEKMIQKKFVQRSNDLITLSLSFFWMLLFATKQHNMFNYF